MCSPSSDVVTDPDHLTNWELLTATRSPRSLQPPSVPPRSPLRPRPTSVQNENSDCKAYSDISPFGMQIVHSQSLPLLATGKTITVHANDNVDGKPCRKSLPESPIMPPLSPVDTTDDGESSSGSSSSLNNNTTSSSPAMSKRTHALLELLSSERAYASDLAFIRDIHIPLALGEYLLH